MREKNIKILKKCNIYNERGITLVALVVTIIVLIILAGISINLLLGENGIITKAKDAKEIYKKAGNKEQEEMLNVEAEIVNLTGNRKTNDLKEGDFIKYDTGVEEIGVITCRVLYEAKSQYGLQIISDRVVGPYLRVGGSDWATSRDFYNKAIENLNKEAEKYLNELYATDARCVGSIPTLKNGIFINKNSENAGPVELKITSTVEGADNMKGTDNNYETDVTQMEKIKVLVRGDSYFLASRYVYPSASYYGFCINTINSSGGLNRNIGWYINNNSATANGSTASEGFRPCFALRSDIKITGGDGTSESPYTM